MIIMVLRLLLILLPFTISAQETSVRFAVIGDYGDSGQAERQRNGAQLRQPAQRIRERALL